MADVIYILNGQEVSASELESYARAAGLSVQEFKDQNNVTVKEGSGDGTEQVNEPPSAFSQIIDGKSPEDFQQVAATEDVPAVTGTEDASKPLEEMPTSELELQLEETSLAIAEIEKELDDKGRYKQSNRPLAYKLNKLKSKKEKEYTQLQVRYTNADKIDFSNPEFVANQLEDRVITEMRAEHGYPYLNVEATGAGNEIVIKNYLGTGKNINVKLDGSEESKKVFKDLNDYDKALTDSSRVALTMESSLNKSFKENNVVSLNKVIKSSGYEIQQVETPGKEVVVVPDAKYPITDYTPATYEYSLTKDGVTIASDINSISEILKSDKKLEGALVQEAYDYQTQAVEKRAQSLDKEKEIITKDPTTTVDYYEDGSFEKDIIKAIQDKGLDLSPEQIMSLTKDKML